MDAVVPKEEDEVVVGKEEEEEVVVPKEEEGEVVGKSTISRKCRSSSRDVLRATTGSCPAPSAIDKWLTAPVHHGHQVQAAPPCSACSQALRPLHNPQRALKTNPNPPTSAAKVAQGTADLRRRPWNTQIVKKAIR